MAVIMEAKLTLSAVLLKLPALQLFSFHLYVVIQLIGPWSLRNLKNQHLVVLQTALVVGLTTGLVVGLNREEIDLHIRPSYFHKFPIVKWGVSGYEYDLRTFFAHTLIDFTIIHISRRNVFLLHLKVFAFVDRSTRSIEI